jgi:hypothetical protein
MVTTYVVVSIAFDYISIMYNISDLLVWAR